MSNFWRFTSTALLAAGLCAAMPASGYAQAQTAHQSPQSIIDAARTAIEQHPGSKRYRNLTVSIRPLDSRLRLARCELPLATHFPPSSKTLGNRVVGVACQGSKPWKIFVRASVSAEQSLPVLVRSLARHSVISSADIELVNFPVTQMGSGFVENPDHVIGMELKRELSAGVPIRANFLAAPKIVKRGQRVLVVYGQGELQVTMAGVAMKDGASGDRIPVRNTSSSKEIDGIVNADGSIRLQ
jgi:flagella basal body P-ring formation protein FlgA